MADIADTVIPLLAMACLSALTLALIAVCLFVTQQLIMGGLECWKRR
jgi:hypothetical protein